MDDDAPDHVEEFPVTRRHDDIPVAVLNVIQAIRLSSDIMLRELQNFKNALERILDP